MAGEQGLAVPTIKVNNDVIGIVPNTFKFTPGDGETKVRAASTGGNNATSVHTQDAEMMYSVVKFHLMNTINNMSMVRDWKANFAANTVEALQRGTGDQKDFSLAYKSMSVTNDPENVAAADGVIEVEMAGDKLEQ